MITPNTDEQLSLFFDDACTPAPPLEQRLAVLGDYAKSNKLSILAKGGHEQDKCTRLVIDRLITPTQQLEFSHNRITTTNDHGTGCALASAIAANLALGLSIETAVEKAENYLHTLLANSKHFVMPKQKDGARNLPMNHFA